jgi:uncharacterized protein (UPF0332 family)
VTLENRRHAIADEVKHAANALRAARALRDMGLGNDALSRLYYAVFHYATALLLTEGVEPTSHKALPGLLGLHFAKRGLLSPGEVAVVGHAWSWRSLADYERHWDADEAVVAAAFAEVEPLIDRVVGLVKGGGWID